MYVAHGIFKIGLLLNIEEAELILTSLRSLNEKLVKERVMTSKLKLELFNAIVQFEREISNCKDIPERLQDEFEL
jgi:hydroxymethylpyrimidine/phosphomethylpyrimidine kinase